MSRLASMLLAFLAAWCVAAWGDEPVGQRPYEMVWANRTADTRPPLVDFENLDGWTVACVDSEACSAARGSSSYGANTSARSSTAALAKPEGRRSGRRKPIPIAGPFDCVNLWVYGNNWACRPRPEDSAGGNRRAAARARRRARCGSCLGTGRLEGVVAHAPPAQPTNRRPCSATCASVEAIEVSGGRNTEDRTLYFDNLAVYQEPLPPLKFEQRPARPFDPCPGRNSRLEHRTGKASLPHAAGNHPARQSRRRSSRRTWNIRATVSRSTIAAVTATWSIVTRRRRADLGDLTAEWEGGGPFQPLAGGGVRFYDDQGKPAIPPEKMELIRCQQIGTSGQVGNLSHGRNAVQAAWRCTVGQADRRSAVHFRAAAEVTVDHRAVSGRRGGRVLRGEGRRG